MGLWVAEPALHAGESVLWRRAANRTQSSGRAVGGYLYLTTSRLVFQANRFDAATGGRSWSAALAQVRDVTRQAPDGNPFSGGLRTRLRVEFDDGGELFVVNKLDDAVVAVLVGAVAGQRG